MPPRIITLLTDFGSEDAFVGIMKGVILGIHPDVQLVDLTHAVPPQAIVPGALLLRSAVGAFPAGTIHVAVIDPGVGSTRRPILVDTEAGFLIGPDNGLLWPAARLMRSRSVRRIENQEFFRHPVSQTFHGRDIFAPVAAHLARGVDRSRFGPVIKDMMELAIAEPQRSGSATTGAVVYVDHFGNLVTNIAADAVVSFPVQRVSVSIGDSRLDLVGAYAAVPEGSPLAIVGSWQTIEIAVRNGSAASMFAAGSGTPVTVVVESCDV